MFGFKETQKNYTIILTMKTKTINLPSRTLSDNDRASMLTRPFTIRIDEQRPDKIYNLQDTIELTASSLQTASYKIEQNELCFQIMGHVPILAAMPFLYLPDPVMLSAVFLEPKFTDR